MFVDAKIKWNDYLKPILYYFQNCEIAWLRGGKIECNILIKYIYVNFLIIFINIYVQAYLTHCTVLLSGKIWAKLTLLRWIFRFESELIYWLGPKNCQHSFQNNPNMQTTYNHRHHFPTRLRKRHRQLPDRNWWHFEWSLQQIYRPQNKLNGSLLD